MNYKKVMRYLRLNSLVPELLDKVDDKKMGFMQSCSSTMLMLGNAGAGALGASTYPCEDRDMLAAEAAYCALEDDLQHYPMKAPMTMTNTTSIWTKSNMTPMCCFLFCVRSMRGNGQ